MNTRSVEMTEAFTPEVISSLKVGQTLTFKTDTGENYYRITKIKDGRIWSKPITLYRTNEVVIKDVKEPKKNWKNKVGKLNETK